MYRTSHGKSRLVLRWTTWRNWRLRSVGTSVYMKAARMLRTMSAKSELFAALSTVHDGRHLRLCNTVSNLSLIVLKNVRCEHIVHWLPPEVRKSSTRRDFS